MLRLYLFGGLRAYVDDQLAIDTHTPRLKPKALLAYLYLERGRYVSKDELSEALWPEADQVGPSRLKQTVLTLRALIEPPRSRGVGWHYLLQRGGAYYFNTLAASWSDLEAFEHGLLLARAAREAGEKDAALAHYRGALNQWRGELLPELRYEPWVASRSAELRAERLDALDAAAELLVARGDARSAIDLLAEVIREDPLRESSYLHLVRALRRDGRGGEALLAYERLRRHLAVEVQSAPGPELTRLAEAIRRERADPGTAA